MTSIPFPFRHLRNPTFLSDATENLSKRGWFSCCYLMQPSAWVHCLALGKGWLLARDCGSHPSVCLLAAAVRRLEKDGKGCDARDLTKKPWHE